jgi:hypothetical protein
MPKLLGSEDVAGRTKGCTSAVKGTGASALPPASTCSVPWYVPGAWDSGAHSST